MPLAAGTLLGTYEIVAPLGKGGMGEVYRARDVRLDRPVALKVLPADVAASADRLARFEQEARVVAGLNHPNIVVLYSVEDEGPIRFLTMELVDGQGLDHLVTAGGLPVARVVELGIALSDALTAAHERGVVHRDLKPANVMLTRDGRVKVLDFGLAKLARADSGLDVTRATTIASPVSADGQVVGTVPYMAPEQIRGEPVDARTDLFALGTMLYELSCGVRPFTGATLADISSAILRDAPPPLASVRIDVPSDLGRVVERCLEKNPRARFQTALDVGNELRRVKQVLESGAVARSPSSDVASIAVLPFVNRSRDEEDEYFSDGLADEMLGLLAKIRGLRVAARSSAFSFKGKSVTVAEVGKSLNVSTVLEGSVRKAGNRVRISVQLVKVADGYHLWSETYDRTLDDIFAVQDDIARAVIQELRAALLGATPDSGASGAIRADVAAAAQGRGEDAEAHRQFLQGRFLVYRGNPVDMERGIANLRQALEREPEHALAWATLSWALTTSGITGMRDLDEVIPAAREAADRARRIAPDLAEAHLAQGSIQTWYDFDWSGAEASFARAIELAPGSADVHRMAGMIAHVLGRPEEALSLIRRAVELDPLSAVAYAFLGRAFFVLDRLDEAEAAFRRALEISPFTSGHLLLAMALLEQGRLDDALAEAQREQGDWYRLQGLSVVHHAAGRAAESDAALHELISRHSQHSAWQIASAFAARRESDATFEWLEKCLEQRDSGLALLKSAVQFRWLQADPRWAPFLRKIGLS